MKRNTKMYIAKFKIDYHKAIIRIQYINKPTRGKLEQKNTFLKPCME